MTAITEKTSELLIGKRVLSAMRVILERETGPKAPLLLREIGFAAGDGLYDRFEQWTRERYQVDSAHDLDASYLGEALSGFFSETGWGSLGLSELGPQVLALDSPDWAEAQNGGAEYPSCHFSCGVLADFFTRLGESRAAVMEVECRSRGEDRCRFLVGSPELLTYCYERMTAGLPYLKAVSGDE
jgi:predicted hydrocarbon binding protein